MSEESRKLEAELRRAFAELFPLVPEHLLPWAPSHIRVFLKDRIADEAEKIAGEEIVAVESVLCEVARPKPHLVDQARLVVDELKAKRALCSSMLADVSVNLERWEKNPEQTPPSVKDLRLWLSLLKKRIVDSGAFV